MEGSRESYRLACTDDVAQRACTTALQLKQVKKDWQHERLLNPAYQSLSGPQNTEHNGPQSLNSAKQAFVFMRVWGPGNHKSGLRVTFSFLNLEMLRPRLLLIAGSFGPNNAG